MRCTMMSALCTTRCTADNSTTEFLNSSDLIVRVFELYTPVVCGSEAIMVVAEKQTQALCLGAGSPIRQMYVLPPPPSSLCMLRQSLCAPDV